MLKQIEGRPDDTPVILVDDLINTGSTFNKQISVLTDAGLHVSKIFVLLAFRDPCSYRFPLVPDIQIGHLFTLRDFGQPLEVPPPEIDGKSFSIEWKFAAPIPHYNVVSEKSGPVIDGDCIYFGSDNGIFYALNQSNGTIKWMYSIKNGSEQSAILSTPALHNGILCFGASDGAVHALDAKTGALQWKYEGADRVGSSPCIGTSRQLLFVGLEFGLWVSRGGIVALDIRTGKTQWQAKIRGAAQSSPLYIEREQLVVIGDNDGGIHAYHPQTGALRWRRAIRGGIFSSFAYDQFRRLICFGGMDGTFYAISAQDGEPVFGKDSWGGIASTPVIRDRIVYISSLNKKLYAVNLDTGNDIWSFTTRGRIFSSPTFFDGSLWIGSNDGKLYEIDPDSGRQRSSFQTSERIVNRPVYNADTKRIFLPTQANEIYCLQRNAPTNEKAVR
jgi:outer membrane protein assembly factor BamB